jgi:hypothetical protein
MFRFLRTGILGSFALGALMLGSTLVGAASVNQSLTLTAGTLSITGLPTSFGYNGVLTGEVLTLTSSFSVTVVDATGTKSGWSIQAQTGALTTTGGDSIPAANHSISGISINNVTGVGPLNSIITSAIPTTTGKIFNAGAGTGMGQSTMNFNTQLIVPANAAAGSYSATMTISIVSGP